MINSRTGILVVAGLICVLTSGCATPEERFDLLFTFESSSFRTHLECGSEDGRKYVLNDWEAGETMGIRLDSPPSGGTWIGWCRSIYEDMPANELGREMGYATMNMVSDHWNVSVTREWGEAARCTISKKESCTNHFTIHDPLSHSRFTYVERPTQARNQAEFDHGPLGQVTMKIRLHSPAEGFAPEGLIQLVVDDTTWNGILVGSNAGQTAVPISNGWTVALHFDPPLTPGGHRLSGWFSDHATGHTAIALPVTIWVPSDSPGRAFLDLGTAAGVASRQSGSLSAQPYLEPEDDSERGMVHAHGQYLIERLENPCAYNSSRTFIKIQQASFELEPGDSFFPLNMSGAAPGDFLRISTRPNAGASWVGPSTPTAFELDKALGHQYWSKILGLRASAHRPADPRDSFAIYVTFLGQTNMDSWMTASNITYRITDSATNSEVTNGSFRVAMSDWTAGACQFTKYETFRLPNSVRLELHLSAEIPDGRTLVTSSTILNA